jgi:hypothetical protein
MSSFWRLRTALPTWHNSPSSSPQMVPAIEWALSSSRQTRQGCRNIDSGPEPSRDSGAKILGDAIFSGPSLRAGQSQAAKGDGHCCVPGRSEGTKCHRAIVVNARCVQSRKNSSATAFVHHKNAPFSKIDGGWMDAWGGRSGETGGGLLTRFGGQWSQGANIRGQIHE